MADKKNRFQNIHFKKRLRQARSYKRPIRRVSENQWQSFLTKIGLNSFLGKLVILALFICLIYLVYLPNFLSVRQITLEGVALGQKQSILATAGNYLTSKPIWPQRNLLLLSKKGLSNYLIENNRDVLRVENVKKNYPNSLTIQLLPRLNQFLLTTKQAVYTLSNDGLVTKKNDLSATSTTSGNLVAIRLNSEDGFQVNQKVASEDALKKIIQTKNLLAKQTQNAPVYFEMEDLGGPDLTALMPAGYKILLDTNSDSEQVLAQFNLLWQNLKSEQKQNLYYIDLRIKNRAYVCYKNTACARDIILNNATTTPAANPIQ